MNKSGSNKLSMYKAVEALLNVNTVKFSGLTVMNTIKTELSQLIAKLLLKEQDLNTVFTGKTLTKDIFKDELIRSLTPVARSLFVFAKRGKQWDVMNIADVKRGMLLRMRENELEIRSKQIMELARGNKQALEEFNLTEADLIILESNINSFTLARNEKETGYAERVAANTELDSLFNKIDQLLKEDLDGVMESFKEKDPTFYNEYRTARVIRDLGYKTDKEETEAAVPSK